MKSLFTQPIALAAAKAAGKDQPPARRAPQVRQRGVISRTGPGPHAGLRARHAGQKS